MKKHIVVIHGGDVFPSYEAFLENLKTKSVDTEYFKTRENWKRNLEKELGEAFEVLSPKMPNQDNAQYKEWKIWFERIIPFLTDGVIFIGHSLGGLFLAKYFSENRLPVRVSAVFLVAAPYSEKPKYEEDNNFLLGDDLSLLTTQSKKVVFYQSKDDQSVPFADFEKYQRKLPHAEFFTFENRGHFRDAVFPELVDTLKAL